MQNRFYLGHADHTALLTTVDVFETGDALSLSDALAVLDVEPCVIIDLEASRSVDDDLMTAILHREGMVIAQVLIVIANPTSPTAVELRARDGDGSIAIVGSLTAATDLSHALEKRLIP